MVASVEDTVQAVQQVVKITNVNEEKEAPKSPTDLDMHMKLLFLTYSPLCSVHAEYEITT